MSSSERILIIDQNCKHGWIEKLPASFTMVQMTPAQYQQATEANQDISLVVLHYCGNAHINLDLCKHIKNNASLQRIPLLAITSSDSLQDKLAAFDAGCDDVIEGTKTPEEIAVRIQKALFHKRCNDQLQSQVQMANQMAFSAMADTSNLGLNIQFLLESSKCDTLDELGMLFFSIIQNYGLNCSLQMRSEYSIKNMESNGMCKELEAQLLTQLCGVGRYYDFGSRTVCNYGRASVLIKNMPADNPDRYGSIKDNTFALMQGLDARITAIDNGLRLRQEHERLLLISQQVKQVMVDIDNSYQVVMRNIAGAVENMAADLERAIPVLALSEDQEKFIEKVAHNCVLKTNQVFNDGLKVDRTFHRLMQLLDHVMGSPP